MARMRSALPRAVTATVTTALVSMIVLVAVAPAAAARVSVVPGTAEGGRVAKLAVRLSNERPDVPTTRLELDFPKDLVVPRVEVAQTGQWVATVTARPLDPPVVVADEEYDEAVDSIVWTGGEVAPRQFEQFLVTAGPLPTGGRLVFAAVQGYADGTANQWSEPGEEGLPGAPTVDLGPPRPERPAGAGGSVAVTGFSDEGGSPVPWILLAGGLLVVGAAGVVGYQGLQRRPSTPTKPAAGGTGTEPTRTGAGRT